MTATAAPFGFRPVLHSTGLDRARRRTIAAAYGTALYKGMMVTLNTNGTIVAAAAAADFLGVFAGVEYTDASGKPTYSNFWPAAQAVMANTPIIAYVWEDFDTMFEVQANGSVAAAAVGDQADVVNVGAGGGITGLSTSALNSTLVGAGAQGQWRIEEISGYPDNAAGDAFTIVRVKMARQQFTSNKVAV